MTNKNMRNVYSSFAHIMGDALLNDPQFMIVVDDEEDEHDCGVTGGIKEKKMMTSIYLCYPDWGDAAKGLLFQIAGTENDNDGIIGNRAMEMMLKNFQQFDDIDGDVRTGPNVGNMTGDGNNKEANVDGEDQRQQEEADIVAALRELVTIRSSCAGLEQNKHGNDHILPADGRGEHDDDDSSRLPKKQRIEELVKVGHDLSNDRENITSERKVKQLSSLSGQQLEPNQNASVSNNDTSVMSSNFHSCGAGNVAVNKPPIRTRVRGKKNRGVKKFGKL
uniref:Uncharacterized protein n=1 Tax=Leptocylindrus danicus TaxID=163516 RepID=A0A7S2LLQ2_9STRA